jgi:hypothetical protein
VVCEAVDINIDQFYKNLRNNTTFGVSFLNESYEGRALGC